MPRTLRQALDETYHTRWRHMRSAACLRSQAEIAAATVAGCISGVSAKGWSYQPPGWAAYLSAVQVDHPRMQKAIGEATAFWYSLGLSPATINKRLNCLSAMGVKVDGCRVKKPVQLKWWLNPEDQRRLTGWLRGRDPEQSASAVWFLMADFIDWTCATGLRVEESLALTFRSVLKTASRTYSLTVPGTKTAAAQATLPLSSDAVRVLEGRIKAQWGEHMNNMSAAPLFPITYDQLHECWQQCRAFLGVEDVPTATLKALRRSFARTATLNGMPLVVLQQYLRHQSMKTTAGYLQLVGGFNEDEMRRYL